MIARAFLVAPKGFEQVEAIEPWKAVEDASAADHAGPVLPGGGGQPRLPADVPAAVDFAKGFFHAGKPVAVICHGPWTLIDADVIRGPDHHLLAEPEDRPRNAGANGVDEEVAVDQRRGNTLISSRKPDDLPAFCATLVQAFSR